MSPPRDATRRPEAGSATIARGVRASVRGGSRDASLALAVAQAEHAHTHLNEAAQWARRALALDPNAAEAYIIIARAEAGNGRDGDARTAYQRYLEIAPRGWHKAEARAALRAALTSPR